MMQASFHAHLDECARCASQPMNLCVEGARLLQAAALGATKSASEHNAEGLARARYVRLLALLVEARDMLRELVPYAEQSYCIDAMPDVIHRAVALVERIEEARKS